MLENMKKLSKAVLILILLLPAHLLIFSMIEKAAANTPPPPPVGVWISEDGNRVAVISDGGVVFFDKKSNNPTKTLAVSRQAGALAISGDGSLLATGDGNKLEFYETEKDLPIWTAAVDVSSLAMSLDGNYLAAGGYENYPQGHLTLFKRDGTKIWKWNSPTEVDALVMSYDGSYLATLEGGWGVYGIHFFSREDNEPRWSYVIENGWISGLQLSSDGLYLTAVVARRTLLLFDTQENIPLWSFTIPQIQEYSSIGGPSMSRDGNFTIVGSDVGLFLFGQSDNVPLWQYSEPITNAVLSADGNYIAAITEDKLHLFNRDDNTPLWTWPVPKLETLAISSNGDYIVVGSIPAAYLFSKENNIPLWSYPSATLSFSRAAISANGDTIVINGLVGTGDWCGGTVFFFGKNDNTLRWRWDDPGRQYWFGPYPIAVSEDGKYIAAATSHHVRLFDAENKDILWFFSPGFGSFGYHYWNGWVSISSDGSYIMAATHYTTKADTLYLFKKENNVPLWSYASRQKIYGAAMSSDGEYIAITDAQNLHFFHKDDNVPVWSSQIGYCEILAMSSSGEYIVVGGNSLRFFRRDNNTPVWSWVPPSGSYLYKIAISADGNYIAAATLSKLYVFHQASSSPLWQYEPSDVLGTYNMVTVKIGPLAVSPNGEFIILGGSTLRLFHTSGDNAPEWEMTRFSSDVAVSSDGKYIISATGSGLDLRNSESGALLWSYLPARSQAGEEKPTEGLSYLVVAGITTATLVSILAWRLMRAKRKSKLSQVPPPII